MTNALAASINSPVSSPVLSREIAPPAGVWVSLETFHFRSAAEFRMYEWPPRTRTTGLSALARSSSAAVGRRCSLSCASCQSALETMTEPSGAVSAADFTAARRSAIDRTFDRSTPSPPPSLWKWASVRPGLTKRPCRSITRDCGPMCLRTAPFEPTATNRSPRTAMACRTEPLPSAVNTLPFTNTRSAGGVAACAAPTTRTNVPSAATHVTPRLISNPLIRAKSYVLTTQRRAASQP